MDICSCKECFIRYISEVVIIMIFMYNYVCFSSIYSTLENSAFLDSAKLLFKYLTTLVRSTLLHRVRVIIAAASLVCTALQHICRDVFADTFAEMHGLVRDWIHDLKVIGGNMFGCEIRKEHAFAKGHQEIEVCAL